MEGKVPNCGILVSHNEDTGLSRRCTVPHLQRWKGLSAKKVSVQTIRESFSSHGPMLFDILPPNLRNVTNYSTDKFKEKIDVLLATVHDEPAFPRLTLRDLTEEAKASNSIKEKRKEGSLYPKIGFLN